MSSFKKHWKSYAVMGVMLTAALAVAVIYDALVGVEDDFGPLYESDEDY